MSVWSEFVIFCCPPFQNLSTHQNFLPLSLRCLRIPLPLSAHSLPLWTPVLHASRSIPTAPLRNSLSTSKIFRFHTRWLYHQSQNQYWIRRGSVWRGLIWICGRWMRIRWQCWEFEHERNFKLLWSRKTRATFSAAPPFILQRGILLLWFFTPAAPPRNQNAFHWHIQTFSPPFATSPPRTRWPPSTHP